MKKGLIIAGASVLLLSGLVAGVFAKYQSTIDSGNGSVTAKTFSFTAEQTKNYTGAFSIDPYSVGTTDNPVATFDIKNYEGDKVSEVDMTVDIKLNWDHGDDAYVEKYGYKYYFDNIAQHVMYYDTTQSSVVANKVTFVTTWIGLNEDFKIKIKGGSKVDFKFYLLSAWADGITEVVDGVSEDNIFINSWVDWSLSLTATQA